MSKYVTEPVVVKIGNVPGVTVGVDSDNALEVPVPSGPPGRIGPQGPKGDDGLGVPPGGTTGQVLKKKSNADNDTEWDDESGAVLSVNGQTGDVNLDADDVGALPDDTFIPSKTSDLTNDSGFITQHNSDYRIYNSVTDIGLTSGSATIHGAFNAMADNTVLMCDAVQFASGEVPSIYGIVELVNLFSSRRYAEFHGKSTDILDYRMYMAGSSGAPSGTWLRITPVTSVNGQTGAVNTKPKTGSVTLAAANWTGSGPYTQTVTVTGATVTANSKVDIQPDATVIQQMLTVGMSALFIANNAGVLTAYAIGATFSGDVTVQATVTEVL